MQHNNLYTFKFISIVTILASLLLSLSSTQLKDRQEYNIKVDKKKNILKSIGLDVASMDDNEIMREYNQRIKDIVLSINGERLNNISLDDLEAIENKSTGQLSYIHDSRSFLPIYVASEPQAFIFPVAFFRFHCRPSLWGFCNENKSMEQTLPPIDVVGIVADVLRSFRS